MKVKEVILKPEDLTDPIDDLVKDNFKGLPAEIAIDRFKAGMGDPKKGQILKPQETDKKTGK